MYKQHSSCNGCNGTNLALGPAVGTFLPGCGKHNDIHKGTETFQVGTFLPGHGKHNDIHKGTETFQATLLCLAYKIYVLLADKCVHIKQWTLHPMSPVSS